MRPSGWGGVRLRRPNRLAITDTGFGMNEIQERKREQAKRLRDAKDAILKSSEIDRSLAHFLGVFLTFPRSALDYEIVYKSQVELGKACKYSIDAKRHACSTVKRHIGYLVKIGALKRKTLGRQQAREWLWSRYSYKFNGWKDSHRHNFYIIDWFHPLWTSGEIDQEMLAEHRNKVRGGLNQGTSAPFEPGHRCPEEKETSFSTSESQNEKLLVTDQIPPATQFESDDPIQSDSVLEVENPTSKSSSQGSVAEQARRHSLETLNFEDVEGGSVLDEQAEQFLEVLGDERASGFACGEPSQPASAGMTNSEENHQGETPKRKIPKRNWRKNGIVPPARPGSTPLHRGSWFRQISGNMDRLEHDRQRQLSGLREAYG